MSKKYVMERIQDVQWEVDRKIREKYLDKVKPLTTKEKYKLIKTGKVQLQPLAKIADSSYGYERWFNFSQYDKKEKARKICEQVQEKLKKEAQKARDEVMIGDMKEALAILEKLRNFKV